MTDPRRKPARLQTYWLILLLFLAMPAAGQISRSSGGGGEVVSAEALISLDKVHPGATFEIAVVFEVSPTWHINAHEPTEEWLIPTELELESLEGFTLEQTVYPSAVRRKLGFSETALDLYEDQEVIGVRAKLSDTIEPGDLVLKAQLRYQACNDMTCLAPTSLEVPVTIPVARLDEPVNRTHAEVFSKLSFTSVSVEEEVSPEEEKSDVERLIEEKGLYLAFVFIFLGGLALNLTPCVYPMIPITIAYFGGQSGGKTSRTFGLAILYVLGMATTYSALGVVAATTGQIFGSALQNPLVLLFVAAVLIGLALSMFGLWEIRVPQSLAKIGGASKKGLLGSYLMGLTVGLVAAPCIGPFVVGLLTYVGDQANPVLGFWMFFTLAMGLGLPYLFLGAASGSISALPRSGSWMVWVRVAFGFILIGMALYFIKTLLPDKLYWILMGLNALIAAIFLGLLQKSGSTTAAFRALRGVVALACVIAAGWFLFSPGHAFIAAREDTNSIAWNRFDEEGDGAKFMEDLLSRGKPILIDFEAEWCFACKELDRHTFSAPAIVELSKDLTAARVDLTREKEPGLVYLKERFGIEGLPWVVFMDPDGNERTDLRVTGFMPPEPFQERLEELLQ